MSVIRLPIEPRGPSASITWELRSNTAAFASPITGATRTLGRSGSRWAATFRYQNLLESYRAIMESFISACRGREQRFYTRDYAYSQRGSFPASELFTNSDFASGTTGWLQANAALTAEDRVMRITATTPTPSNVLIYQTIGLTQYAPFAMRSLLIDGLQTSGLSIGRALNDGVAPQVSDYGTARGLGTVSLVALSSAAQNQFPAVFASQSAFSAGAYLSVPFTSLARCALVDDGPNMLLRSDTFDHSDWGKAECSITADFAAAPDGTTTADRLVESTNNTAHYVVQTVTVSSAAADYATTVAVKADVRSNFWLQMNEVTGSTAVYSYFILTGGGSVSASQSTGANWANLRAFVRDLGNGWVACTIVARKTNAATQVQVLIGAAIADGSGAYVGSGTGGILMWRATLAQSSVPTRLALTTSAPTSSAQTGGALYLKGLPASTSGLLLANDQLEIITPNGSEFKRLRSPLNSDAAGLGYAEIEPVIRDSPADNAAVIIQKPMVRMLLDADSVQWTNHRPGLCDLEFTAVEDITP